MPKTESTFKTAQSEAGKERWRFFSSTKERKLPKMSMSQERLNEKNKVVIPILTIRIPKV